MKISKKLFLSTLLGLSFVTAALAADVAKLAETCTACHGKDGASTNTNIPSIGGMSAKYLNITFKAYKAKERVCAETAILTGADKDKKTDMCKVVEALSDDDVKKLVSFYSGKKFARTAQVFDAALAEKGKEIHKANCEKCHSEGGSLAADDSSILAGQQKGYLDSTFKELLADKRMMEKKMKAKFETMDKDSVEALAHYYASFK
jgi:sulfide dehydrogenase cytochrome subunit